MIITPRPYFSYSQFSSFHYSKERFLNNYYYGKFEDNQFLQLGKLLGGALQFRKRKETEEIEKIRKQIPVAPIYEKEIKAKINEIPLLCYLDGFDPLNYEVTEYKTGMKASMPSWRNQMLFYALALYQNHKRLPEKITLYWCPTQFNDDSQLILTGEVKEFDIKITLDEIIMFSGEITKTWESIKRLCEQEYKMFGILPIKMR